MSSYWFRGAGGITVERDSVSRSNAGNQNMPTSRMRPLYPKLLGVADPRSEGKNDHCG